MKNKAPLSEELFERLRIDILKEKFPPGSKLTEQRICELYSVSRTPVREAFKTLEAEELIETIPNRGAFVIGFSKGDLHDLFVLREELEVRAVRWAVDRIYEDEFDALEESYEFMEFYTGRNDSRRMPDINVNFHKTIYQASHNRVLSNTLTVFQTYIKNSVYTKPYENEHLKKVFSEHKAIFKAFKSKDPDAGEKAIRVHIRNSAKRALKG